MGGESDAARSGDQHWVIRLRAASRATGAVLAALGSTVLCAWFFRLQVLISLSPRLAPMKPNTALGFLGTGVALWSLHADDERTRRRGRWLAWGVLLLGSVTLAEYLFGWDLGIDRLLYLGADTGRWPARMSIGAATHFTLLGCALLLLDTRFGDGHRPSEWLALPVALSSLAALLGYMYGVESLYAVKPYSSMALHTAIAFQFAAYGVLFARPNHGLMCVVSSTGPGGQLARRLLPAIY